MPECDAATCHLGDGYSLTAAGVRRDKDVLSADLLLENGSILFQDRAVLNTPEGRETWAMAAQTVVQALEGPTTERLVDAILNSVLPDALAKLQEAPRRDSQADQLVGMISELLGDFVADTAEAVELFHDPGQIAYATMPVGDHRETWPLQTKGFRQWMARRYYEQHLKTPNTQALVDATNVLAGAAIYDGPEYQVSLRLAEHAGTIYLDLCNERWEAVAIDRDGWRVVSNPPVKFRRTRAMAPLPIPVPGGSLTELRAFLNLPKPPEHAAGDDGDDREWILTVAWLIAAFRPHGPYPVLVILGEQGSAKSTEQGVLRALLDPNTSPIRSLPRTERDLMISANNSWCLAFDNLSHLADWQSDALCRISTGGGLATRELYSDLDETILDVQRPIILNGIEEIVTRADLLDRSISKYLPTIPKSARKPEKQFREAFERQRPAILGAILDAVSTALRNAATVTLEEHPRMADFAEWIVAAEPALPWEAGAFITAYTWNQADANALALEVSSVAQALRDFMELRTKRMETAPWWGTATKLLGELETITDDKTKRQKSWPGSARTLSNTLRRLQSNLRAVGIDLVFDERKHGGTRIITITDRPE
jgi:hypothetical protein